MKSKTWNSEKELGLKRSILGNTLIGTVGIIIFSIVLLFIVTSVTNAQGDTLILHGDEKLYATCEGKRLRVKRISRTEVKLVCHPDPHHATATPTVEPTQTIAPPSTSTPIATETAVPPTTTATSVPPTATATGLPPTATATSQPPQSPGTFLETFDGDPSSPRRWNPDNWDVTVHSRNYWFELPAMEAAHGPNCEAPPMTHTVTAYEDTVYNCKNHIMTAINDDSYGVIYLTPNQLVDFSNGEAVVRFDVSTLRTSKRDWIDLWITPYDDNLQLPLPEWMPDLNGEPRYGIQVEMSDFDGGTPFKIRLMDDFHVEELEGNWWTGYEEFFVPDAKRRDTFELRISKNHVKFGMPDYDFWWVDTEIPELDWGQGVVQLGHHSYNPTKDCSNCAPNSWHWDNVFIEPAVPFNMIKADRRYTNIFDGSTVNFAAPAPKDAHLRFAGVGQNFEVSFDGGASWQPAQVQDQRRHNEHFWSFWTPIPEGTQQVQFRADKTMYFNEDWMVRDLAIWSLNN